MRAYVVSRLAQTALVVFLSLTAVFVMVRLSGDPVLLFMPMDIQAKDVTEFRQRLGFNDPLPVQYARFVGGVGGSDTLGGARGAGRGLHPDRARQGPRRGTRDRQTHASQLGDPDRHAGGARGGPDTRRRGDHRDDLRLARPGSAHRPGAPEP